MALVHGWYGNGAANGALGTVVGRGDDAFSAVNGGTDVAIASGKITLTEAGGGSRNFRRDLSTPVAAWATSFGYTHRTPAATLAIAQVLDVVPNQIARIEVNTTGTVTLRNGANGTVQTSAGGTLVAGSDYCLKFYGDNTGALTLKIYPAAGGSVIATLSGSSGTTTDASRFVYGAVTNATCTGLRAYDNVEIYDTDDEPPFLTEATFPVRVVSNASGYTASSGDLTATLADASDSTYAQSPSNPSGSVLAMQMARMSREDVVSVVVRDDNSEAGTVSRTVEILYGDGTTVLGDATYNITSTSSANHTVTTDDPLPAGEVFYVRLTDTAA